jgi:hypothetical protein
MVAMPLSNSSCTEVRWLNKRLECLRGIKHYTAAGKKYFSTKKTSWVGLIKELLAGLEII